MNLELLDPYRFGDAHTSGAKMEVIGFVSPARYGRFANLPPRLSPVKMDCSLLRPRADWEFKALAAGWTPPKE